MKFGRSKLLHCWHGNKVRFKKHAFSQGKYHFWWDWALQKMHVVLQNACCKGTPPHTVVLPQSTPGSLSWCRRSGFYIDSLKLPVHGHVYIEQSAQRTLKVAHSLWFTQSQIRVPKLGTGVFKIRRMGFLEQWKRSLIKLTSLPNMLKVSKSHVVQCVPVQTQIVTCILLYATCIFGI